VTGAAGESTGSLSALLASAAGNTIGQLQELCVRHGLPMPMYDLLQVEGQPHQRSFHYGVRVGNLKAEGEGSSKKDAKRDAAQAMLKILRARDNQPADSVFKVEETNGTVSTSGIVNDNGDDDDDNVTNPPVNGGIGKDLSIDSGVDNVSNKLSSLRIETLTPAHSDKIHSFYARLSDSVGEKLAQLHRAPLVKKAGSDFVSMLTELAKEQLFDVTFVEEEERTDDGHVLALVQLSSLPVAVSCGQGPTYELAQHEAAFCALAYLKLLTKRNKE
jgi:RISC-loading complex subunit TARBP2